ncbi:MAG: helix-turn-helix domain-containing protein [Pseudomonadota bacterium]
MDDIAAEAGVTKRTVYHRFDGEDALIGPVLSAGDERSLSGCLSVCQSWAPQAATTQAAFVDALFAKIRDWADRPGWTGPGYSRLALEMADLPGHPARVTTKAHKAAIEAWLSEALQQRGAAAPEAEARRVMPRLEGAMAPALLHQDASYIQDARRLAADILV